MQSLDLRLTESARAHIASLMHGKEVGTLPAIFFASSSRTYNSAGVLTREDPPHWYLNVYTKAQIEQLSADYAALGRSLVYDAQGVFLCIPQPQLSTELAGKTLDVQDHRVCVR